MPFWNGQLITGANDVLLDMLGYTREELAQGVLRHGRLTPPGHEEADSKATEETRLRGSCTPYEKEFLRKDGKPGFPSWLAELDSAVRCPSAVFFVLDLAARRQAEDRLRRRSGIEVVGQLAGGMAHEADNQMSVVLGAASFIMARKDLPRSRKAGRGLHPASRRAHRLDHPAAVSRSAGGRSSNRRW